MNDEMKYMKEMVNLKINDFALNYDYEKAADMLRALADPERLKLLEMLSEGELCVSDMASRSGDEISTISQRLKLLKGQKFVKTRRQGKFIYYSLTDQHIMVLIHNALEHSNE
jgi:DNA-binding transcriptional ArsR family regulator